MNTPLLNWFTPQKKTTIPLLRVRKSHCHVFLEGLIQAKPPLKPFVDAETNLSVFISLLLPKVHFLKVTRVVTLAPP